MVLEADIEAQCVEIVEALGGECLKLDRIRGYRGRTDRLFLLPEGKHVIVEFKRPGETPGPQQLARHRKLNNIGHKVHVLDTVEDFQSLLWATLGYR